MWRRRTHEYGGDTDNKWVIGRLVQKEKAGSAYEKTLSAQNWMIRFTPEGLKSLPKQLKILSMPSGESRHSARGPHQVADPDIRIGEQFNMFPSVSRLFLRWRGRPKAIAKLDEGHGRILPLDSPLSKPSFDKIRHRQAANLLPLLAPCI